MGTEQIGKKICKSDVRQESDLAELSQTDFVEIRVPETGFSSLSLYKLKEKDHTFLYQNPNDLKNAVNCGCPMGSLDFAEGYVLLDVNKIKYKEYAPDSEGHQDRKDLLQKAGI